MKEKNIHIIVIVFVAIVMGIMPSTAKAESAFGIKGSDLVVDQAGRKIRVKNPFQRIISLYGAHTENLYSLGLNKEIVGVSRHESYPPDAMSKKIFSYREDPEKFMAAKPDLVLIRPMIDRGYPKLVSRLEKSGISVVSLQPGTLSDMFTYWRILGLLTGKMKRAETMTDHFRSSVSYFRSKTAGIAVKKRVYFEAIHGKMKTFSTGSMAIFALETAGGINVATDARPVRNTNIAAYGKERILSHGEEIDVFLAQSGAMNRPSLSLIKSESGFQAIKAIRNNQVYIIDEAIVSRPTLRLLTGIYEIGSKLYPDRFKEDILKKIEF